MLRATEYDRFIATTRPWHQAGIGGPPPEQLNMEKSDGTWRISLQMLLKESVQQYMRSQHEDAGDELLAGLDAEIQRVEHGEVVEYSQFVQRLQTLKNHVDAVARTRHLQAKRDQEERLLAWRASPAGKAAIVELTAAGSRLQLRLVLTEEEAGEFDIMKNPLGGGQLRVSREIMLNEKAFASASVGPSVTDGRPVVLVTMTDAGANQMEWVTSNNINHGLAIIFDGKLITAPNIRSTIRSALVIDGGVNGFENGEPERIVAAIRGGK
jgi:preprotein translocase subunit SecD